MSHSFRYELTHTVTTESQPPCPPPPCPPPQPPCPPPPKVYVNQNHFFIIIKSNY